MARYPYEMTGEYRGRSQGGSFERIGDDGEKVTIDYTDGLKFEVELADQDVELHIYRLNKLDEVGDFDASKLQKGQQVRFQGVISTGSWGASDRLLKAELVPSSNGRGGVRLTAPTE